MFPGDAKARHDEMVGLFETMMTADSLRLTACGLAELDTRSRRG
jgi:hypothetical protein